MKIRLAIDNVRSAYNVGSILRSAIALGIDEIITIGITPHLETPNDPRLPHVVDKAAREIRKTALGGDTLPTQHVEDVEAFLELVEGHQLVAIEHAPSAIPLSSYTPAPTELLTVVVGNEVDGVHSAILNASNTILTIETSGSKNSLNVGSATAIALYALQAHFVTMDI